MTRKTQLAALALLFPFVTATTYFVCDTVQDYRNFKRRQHEQKLDEEAALKAYRVMFRRITEGDYNGVSIRDMLKDYHTQFDFNKIANRM